jgi:hypothetical protein
LAQLLRGCGILLDKALPVSGYVGIDENSGYGTLRLAKTTVDALVWIDINHVLAFIDAIYRTNGHTGLVHHANARFGYYVRQFNRLLVNTPEVILHPQAQRLL